MRNLVIFICTLTIFFQTAYAAEVKQDNVNGKIVISGQTSTEQENDYITISVNTLDAQPECVQFTQILSSKEGVYEYSYTPDMVTGEYEIRIMYKGVTSPEIIPLSFKKFDEIFDMVNDYVNVLDGDDLKNYLENNREILGINSAVYDYVCTNRINFDSVYSQIDSMTFTSLSDFINTFYNISYTAVCSLNNAGLCEVLVADISDISNLKIYDIFDGLSVTDKQKVYSLMGNCTTENLSDIQKVFARCVLMQKVSISNWTTVQEMFQNKVDDIADIDLTNFNKNSIDVSKEMAGKTYSTFEALQTALNYRKPVVQETPPSRPTGGGGGGGISVAVPSVPEKDDKVNNSTVTEQKKEIFVDLEGYGWAKESIEYLYSKKIVAGVSDGNFAPSDNVTREAFSVILARAFEFESGQTADFADVVNNSWYDKEVNALHQAGIINGVGNGFFGVGMPITRQDLCVMLYRTLKHKGYELQTDNTEFKDKEEIDEYAYEAVCALKNAGIINGFEDGTFRPKNNTTRAEMAKMISSVLKEQEK